MGTFKMKFGVILAIVAMVIVSSACGPSTQPPPSGNQPPVISSLTAAETDVYPLSIVEVRCEASDPDGDAISYAWSTTGGSFTGTGSTVSWVAPEHYGDYEVTVTVEDDQGNSTARSITLNVVANRDPQIISLVAEPDTVLPEGQSTITCAANDPDGDVLSYTWSTTDGSITGVGNTVTWIAPDREGEFTITVTVNDGEGGQNIQMVSVTVVLTEKTETFNPLANETGNVSHSGDKDTSRTLAGDIETNESYRAFWSFDLYSLRGVDVKDAKLTLTTKNVVGQPFSKTATGLAGLHLWRVRYDPGQLPDFDTARNLYPELTSVLWEAPTVIDVTTVVGNIAKGTTDRLQVEAGFTQVTNGNYISDYIEWSKVTLTVTYAEK